MFTTGKLLFLYCESLVHPGAGSGIGAIDLPIQRERVTNWPIIQSSGIKGSMREHFESKRDDSGSPLCTDDEMSSVFGPHPLKGNAADNSGAISFGDASVLLFPVRSLRGTFAYITCPLALARLQRTLQLLPDSPPAQPSKVKEIASPGANEICLPYTGEDDAVVNPWLVTASGNVVLEEFVFSAKGAVGVRELAEWILDCWTRSGREAHDAPWINLAERIAVVHDEVFKDFVEFSTEVLTRNRIDDDKGTVADGGLWTEECLPRETLLYSVFLACKPRKTANGIARVEDIVDFMTSPSSIPKRTPERIWLGGDVTTGRGIIRTFFA